MKRNINLLFLFLFIGLYAAIPEQIHAQDEDAYAVVCETPPSAVGGDEAVIKLVVYPEAAKSAKIEGKVYILVFLNEKGAVDDAKLIKGIGAGCDEAAISAVKKAKFNPGKNGGAPVKSKLTMALTFKLKK